MTGPLAVSLIVVSTRAARGERPDQTAELLRPVLGQHGFDLRSVVVVADDRDAIRDALLDATIGHDLVLTTGGTGVAESDVTPEVTAGLLDVVVPGLGEAMRAAGMRRTPHAMGGRGLGGFRAHCLVVNLPGRPTAAVENFLAVASALGHLIALRRGPVADARHGDADRPPGSV